MEQQENTGKARMIGYAIGISAFIMLAVWKFLIQ